MRVLSLSFLPNNVMLVSSIINTVKQTKQHYWLLIIAMMPVAWLVVSTIFMMFRDYRPLKFFTIISALLLLIAIAMFVPVFIEYMQTGLVPRFPTLIVSGFIGIASLLTFFCGVVLEVITKKHKQLYELMLLKK